MSVLLRSFTPVAAVGRRAHATLKYFPNPNPPVTFVKTFIVGSVLATITGAMWKQRHIRKQRAINDYYDELAKQRGDKMPAM